MRNAIPTRPSKFRSFSQLDDPQRIVAEGFLVKLKTRKQPSRLDSRFEQWKSNLHKQENPYDAVITELKRSISQEKIGSV